MGILFFQSTGKEPTQANGVRQAESKHKSKDDHWKFEIKPQFLLNIKAVVECEEIPFDLIINWDQTGIKYMYVPVWSLTMEKEGSKKVENAGEV